MQQSSEHPEQKHASKIRLLAGSAVCNFKKGEDRVLTCEEEHLYAVFDGHAGSRFSQNARDSFLSCYQDELKSMTANSSTLDEEALMSEVMRGSFARCNETLRARNLGRGGTTAVVLAIWNGYAYCANAGDSRVVLSKAGDTVCLSIDHKPSEAKSEVERIQACGGAVEFGMLCDDQGDGVLQVSRGLGNFTLPGFSCEPFVASRIEITDPEVEFFILASDGLWDVVSNEEAVKAITSFRKTSAATARECANQLAELAIQRGSHDDIAVMVVLVQPASLNPMLLSSSVPSTQLSEEPPFMTPPQPRRMPAGTRSRMIQSHRLSF